MESIIANKFNEYLESIRSIDSNNNDFNHQIFIDLFKIREALWIHKVKYNREKDYTISEIFQDILTKYLKIALTERYSIILEHYYNKYQPDILIQKDGKFISAIEVKTTIGYNRDLVKNNNYMTRINSLSNCFNIPQNKIIYIFESCSNVTAEFKNIYTSTNNNQIKEYIFPLFLDIASPYNIKKNISQEERKVKYELSSIEEINNYYISVNLDNFNTIIDRIK